MDKIKHRGRPKKSVNLKSFIDIDLLRPVNSVSASYNSRILNLNRYNNGTSKTKVCKEIN